MNQRPNLFDLPGQQSPVEEMVNAITHGVGATLGVAALALLVTYASMDGDPWRIVAMSVYGTSIVLLFSASTFFHALRNRKAKQIFWILDHAAIYLLIAGTYTPFTLVTLRGPWGWSIFGVVWGLAIIGIIYKAFWIGRLPWLSVTLYLVMGWVGAIAAWPLLNVMPTIGAAMMLGGGLLYSGGVVFFLWHKLPFHHVIWHGFVLAGAAVHCLAITIYVLPLS
jgi:hemolysin III